MQAGFIGMNKAATEYAPDKGMKFSSYAIFHIKREMRRALGISSSKRDASLYASSLDAPLIDDSEDITLLDTLAAPEEKDNPLERNELREAVRSAVERMKHDDARRAIEAYYWEGKTEEQIGEAGNVTKQNISNLLYRGYRELYNDTKLRRWAVDYDYIDIYRRKSYKAFNTSFSSVVEDIIIQAEEKQSKIAALKEMLGSLI
jgi:RNA polymerase sigma factor (sigma-70 family)